ncbi:MAG: hypothetical protein JNL97_01055 [Verrucomicrobiales bacterium]|nr:hypothetical protein [Verrucomicrobiales bacterium]
MTAAKYSVLAALRRSVRGIRSAFATAGVGLLCLAASAPVRATSVAAWPSLSELSTRLRTELPSLPPPDAAHTNAETYARALAPWVLAPDPTGGAADEARTNPVPKTQVYPGSAGYVRVGVVDASLRAALRAALQGLRQQGPVSGWIVDLRFAGGSDIGAGIDAASEFAAPDRSVDFRLGDSRWTVASGAEAFDVPVLVLVNRQTRQAAEAMAAAIRAVASKALVLGSPTAGQARRYRSVSVSESLVLQVAAESLRLPDGSEFPATGLGPDLKVAVPESDERAYAIDEYRRVSQGRALVASGPGRLNEAELVRRRRQPRSPFDDPHGGAEGSRRGATRQTVGAGENRPADAVRNVQDPALALALDLVSGAANEGVAAGSEAPSAGDSR